MKTPKLAMSYWKYTDSALETKAESVVLAMTDNANFPKPNPTIASLQAAITAFSEAMVAAVDGGRIRIAERRQARKVLEGLLIQLSAYVMMTANGDVNMLISSGLDVYKEPEASAPIEVPQAPELSSGANTGEVLVKVPVVKGAKSYFFEYTADPLSDSSVWQQVVDTRSKVLITGLTAGKKYWFRVMAIGLRGARTASKEVSYIVQ